MPVPVPTGLSPSRVDSFTSCPLAFRFSSIDKLPEPPAPWTTTGTLVHRALELLFGHAAPDRTLDAALGALEVAVAELRPTDDWQLLGMDPAEEQAFVGRAEALVRRYFDLEDPRRIEPVGLELRLEADLGGTQLRGVIDRLERADDGTLVVTDYKTGRVPSERDEQGRLGGVHFYAWLCEQTLGERPSRVQLLYLSEPVAIVARPTDQSIAFLPKRVTAVWKAIERACARDDFRPKPSKLCDFCAYRPWCPSFGGDPSRAADEAPAVLRAPRRAGATPAA